MKKNIKKILLAFTFLLFTLEIYGQGTSPFATVNTPDTPVISDQNCSNATLTRNQSPPGITWYWQGTINNGTSTKNSGLNYPVKISGTYYLRARDNNGNWSTNSSSVAVILGVTGATNWYADVDNDNLGDPNSLLVACSKPDGYVANDLDQCPNIDGNGSANGCPVPVNELNENYIHAVIPQKAVTTLDELQNNKDAIKSITYFDGLGRAKQSIAIKQSPSEQDIVTHMEYDALGRQVEEFLPYISNTNGSINSGSRNATQEYYKTNYSDDFSGVSNTSSINAFSKKEFENSPLNRVLKQAAPGKDWALGNGHEIEFDYQTNSAQEVKLYEVTTTVNSNGARFGVSLEGGTNTYLPGELYKVVTKDENHNGSTTKLHTTEEFKTKEGQVILKRTYALINNIEEPHDTYYVYDDYGNLTFVLPPKSEANEDLPSSQELLDLCYRYVYDTRNRLVEKQIPGKGKEYIIYDALDRPVLTQDANLRANDKWLFTKYDVFGRVIYTGMYTHSTTLNQSEMQFHFTKMNNVASKYYEQKLENLGAKNIFYSNLNFPSSNTEVLTINYYDNYTFHKIGTESSVNLYKKSGIQSTSRLQGLATGTKIRVLNTNNWITTVTYYDEKARPIHVYMNNEYLRTIDVIESELDFVGRVLETKSIHKKTDQDVADIVVIDVFDYDHSGRLLSHNQCIGDSSLISCSKGAENSNNIFNAPMTLSNNKIITNNSKIVLKPGFSVKALSGKSVVFRIDNGNAETIVENEYDELGQLKSKKVGGNLQEVDYTYNIRGWLKNINEDDKNDNDLFNFSIKYNKPTSGEALYNGNISQTSWNTQSVNSTTNPVLNEYTYTYDALNRIQGATGTNTSNYDVSGISYDKNGNILSLNRNGWQGATNFSNMDKLVYLYSSDNKLKKVVDAGNTSYGFKEVTSTNDDFVYDVNGNMIVDRNKGISNIRYNHLNLPERVTINGKHIDYVYDASGVKLRKTVESIAIDYAGNYIYKNRELQFFNHPEGYTKPVIASGSAAISSFDYIYQYKDHLGNIRLSYTDANKDGIITASSEIIEESNYYPFGLKHKGYNTVTQPIGNGVAQKFKYNGKEYEESLGYDMYEYESRHYDAALSRFVTVDPKSEDYDYQSTYAYAANNPIYYIDNKGENPEGCCGVINPVNMFNFVPGKKPILTFGLHKIKLPTASRKTHGGAGAFVDNVLGSVWNGIATSWNEGMNGKTLTEMTVEGVKGMEEMADRAVKGEATLEDAENMVATLLVRKVGSKGKKPSIKAQALDVKKNLNGNKNSVNVGTVDGVTHYDLDGATHKGVETPHVQNSYKHTNPKTGQSFINKDRKNVRAMNQQDIRTVRKVLKKRNESN